MDKNLERELNSIQKKLDHLDAKLDGHIDKIARIETNQKGMITVLTLFITSALGGLVKYFT